MFDQYTCAILQLQLSLSLYFRQVLAGLLSMADRADWRNCKLSKEEEVKMVDDFKQGFREFDPAEWQRAQATNLLEVDDVCLMFTRS